MARMPLLQLAAIVVALLTPAIGVAGTSPASARATDIAGDSGSAHLTQHVIVVSLARQKFINALSSFASEHGFELGLATTDKRGYRYRIELRRLDARIVVENPATPAQYSITYLAGDTAAMPDAEVRLLAGQLRQAVIKSKSGQFTGPD